MKIAVYSDIHDNEARLEEALAIIKAEKVTVGICCGDISRLETLKSAAKGLKKLYVVLGNMDHNLKSQTEFMPENVVVFSETGCFKISGKNIAIVHNDRRAKELAGEDKYDFVFYGHTHTPWEKKIGHTTLLNPGEVSGQFGPASFAIVDLTTMKSRLKLLK